MPNQLPVFACGIILYFLVTSPKEEWTINPSLVLVTSILYLIDLSSGRYMLFGPHLLFSIAFILLGYCLSKKDFWIFVNPITTYIGKVSYSMYLVHFAILYWLTRLKLVDLVPANPILNYCVRYLCVLVLSTVISTVFYNIIEVPFQRLGARLIRRTGKVISVS